MKDSHKASRGRVAPGAGIATLFGICQKFNKEQFTVSAIARDGSFHDAILCTSGRGYYIPRDGVDHGLILITEDGVKYFLPAEPTSFGDVDWMKANLNPGTFYLGNPGGSSVAISQQGDVYMNAGDANVELTKDTFGESKASISAKSVVITSAAAKITSSASGDGCEYSLAVRYNPKDLDSEPVYSDRIGKIVGYMNAVRDVLANGVDSLYDGTGSSGINLGNENISINPLEANPYSVQMQEGVYREVTHNNPNKGPVTGTTFSGFSSTDFRKVENYFIDGRVVRVTQYQTEVSGDLWGYPPARSLVNENSLPNMEKRGDSTFFAYTGSETGEFAEMAFPTKDEEDFEDDDFFELKFGEMGRNIRFLMRWNAEKVDWQVIKGLRVPVTRFSDVYTRWKESGYEIIYSRSRIYHADNGIRVNIGITMGVAKMQGIPSGLIGEVDPSRDYVLKWAEVKWESFGVTEKQLNGTGRKAHGTKNGTLYLNYGGPDNNYTYIGNGVCHLEGVTGFEHAEAKWTTGGGGGERVVNERPTTVIRHLVYSNDTVDMDGAVPSMREQIENDFIDQVRPDLQFLKSKHGSDAMAAMREVVKFNQYINQVKTDGMSFTGLRMANGSFRTSTKARVYLGEEEAADLAKLVYRGQSLGAGWYTVASTDDSLTAMTGCMVNRGNMTWTINALKRCMATLMIYFINMLQPKSTVMTGDQVCSAPLGAYCSGPTFVGKPSLTPCLTGALSRINVNGGPPVGIVIPSNSPITKYNVASGVEKGEALKAIAVLATYLQMIMPHGPVMDWASGGFGCGPIPDPGEIIDNASLGGEGDVWDRIKLKIFGKVTDDQEAIDLFADSVYGKSDAPFPGYGHMLDVMKLLSFRSINRRKLKVKVGDTEIEIIDFGSGIGNVVAKLFEVEDTYDYEK